MALRPIFYDTETTGIRPDRDRVVEIAAYDPVQNRTFEKLIHPGIPIPAEVSTIHHITDDMVKDCPSFAQIGQEFIEFCEGETVLIAHNNDTFDMLFLKHELARHSVAMPEWKFLDSLKWSRRYRSDLPRHSLQFLREIYGVTANNAHRALDDVIVLHQIFTFMTDDLMLEDICALLNRPKDVQHMPFGKYQGKLLKDVPSDYYQWMFKSGAFDKAENHELRQTIQKLGLLPA